MVTKTLTITKEAYDALKKVKKDGESFSKTVLRITTPKGLPPGLLGCMKDDPDFVDRMRRNREEAQRGWEERAKKLEKMWNDTN